LKFDGTGLGDGGKEGKMHEEIKRGGFLKRPK